jgi:hypothetical protein
LFQAAVPIVATTLAYVVPAEMIGYAGFSYSLYGLAGFVHGSMHGKHRRGKLKEMEISRT